VAGIGCCGLFPAFCCPEAGPALASLSPARLDKNVRLLPPISESREISLWVARAVAQQAMAEGVAAISDAATLSAQLRAEAWEPVYLPYERIP